MSYAIALDDTQGVSLLYLEGGAFLDFRSMDGKSPLHRAAGKGTLHALAVRGPSRPTPRLHPHAHTPATESTLVLPLERANQRQPTRGAGGRRAPGRRCLSSGRRRTCGTGPT